MSDHTDRLKAMRFEYPEYIPVSVSFLPATWKRYREQLEDLVLRHPAVFPGFEKGKTNFDNVWAETYKLGDHTDEWGCVWTNIFEGAEAFVHGHPLPERDMINSLKAPAPGAGLPHGFMFLRLTYLRGYEECMIDFAEEPPELQKLIDIVCGYNVSEVEGILKHHKPEIMYFGDDLGTQNALPISPTIWRRYLKPAFQRIYKPCKEAGVSVYMHTDGHIVPIIKDLIDCGVDVVNPQIGANGLDNLVRECKGKLCVNLDLDRQMFPFATPEEIDRHIFDCIKALGAPEGGLWLIAECGPDVPLENIEAICNAFEKYRSYYR